MTGSTALQSFIDKWRGRWPEWPVAETFVPAEQRDVAVAWFALLQEFEDIMNVTGDPLPADAKLGWWAEELRDWSRRRSRHPLGRVLEPHVAPWAALAEALPVLKTLREPWAQVDEVFTRVQPLSVAIAAVEAALFGGKVTSGPETAVGAQWLVSRWLGRGETQGKGLDALLAQWPARAAGSLPRRLLSNLARGRALALQKTGAEPRPVSRLALLWSSWRAARG